MASRISSAYTTAASADSVKQSQTDTPFAGIQTWHSGFHRVYTSQASDWARIRLALHSPVLGIYLQGIATVDRWVWVAGYQAGTFADAQAHAAPWHRSAPGGTGIARAARGAGSGFWRRLLALRCFFRPARYE